MKSKKGFMLGEYTLKMIIAVLCILLLMYLLFSLYSNNKKEKGLIIAKGSLDELKERMNLAEEDSPQTVTILVQKSRVWAEAWNLYYFPKKSSGTPKDCINNYCLCICYFSGAKNLFSENFCNDDGKCAVIDYPIENFKTIELPADININFKDNKFTITKK